MANTKLPARLLDTSAVPALNVTGDLTVDTTTLKVDSTNNRVGIGTSPSQPLHVDATGNTTAALFDNNGTNGDVVRVAKNGTDILKIRAEGTADVALDASGGAFIFKEGGSEAMRLDSSGNVGIGTSSPSSLLHLGGSTNKGIEITSSTANAGYLAAYQDQAIFSINRDGSDGSFADTAKAAAVIKLNSAAADSNIVFQTTTSNNAEPTTRVAIDKNGKTKFHGNVELSNGKPIFSETDNGTHQYSHLCTASMYSGSNQGTAINTNIPSHNVTGNNMFMITIKGFTYDSAGGGIIDCNIGMYSGENGFHNASYSGSNIPKQWLGKIRVGYTSANKVIILLGDIDTSTNYEIAVSCGVQGFYGVDPAYFSGWTTSAFTSLSAYTGVVNIPPKETTMIGFEAYSTGFSKAAGWHTISNSMSTESYDHGGFYDTSTGKFQPTIAGMYMFTAGGYAHYNSGTTGQERYAFSLSKNGTLGRIAGGNYSDGDSPLVGMTYVTYLNGSSDYVVLSMYSAVATTLGISSHPIWWQGHLINAGPGGSATSWTI